MTSQSDYDSPWKDVLDLFFEDAMAFFFPPAHAQINWARGYEFLDKELQKITADAALGRRVADKLVKVWLKDGQELRVFLHIEVQGQRETDFEWRVLVYHFRRLDRFAEPVATFVILTDEEKNWRPSEYRAELLANSAFPLRQHMAKQCALFKRIIQRPRRMRQLVKPPACEKGRSEAKRIGYLSLRITILSDQHFAF